MDKVYIVNGSTGEYSDRTYWTVCVFASKTKADALAKKLNDWAKKNGVDWESGAGDYSSRGVIKKEGRTLDPYMQIDYTGVGYGVEEANFEPLED